LGKMERLAQRNKINKFFSGSSQYFFWQSG